jgi:hypothetical protein
LTADMSVAPEIARLAEAVLLAATQPAAHSASRPGHGEQAAGQAEEHTAGQAEEHTAGQAEEHTAGQAAEHTAGQAAGRIAAPLTLGTLAHRLRSIAATPERWWSLVRFEPGRSVEITVDEDAAHRAWLVILPPGHAGQDCDCDVATMIAGEATEGTPASAGLRPGPVRVHGERHGRHELRSRGAGYSISLHARARRS